MYCPKCRTEYRKGFNTCTDCEIALVEGLPSLREHEQINKGFHSIRNQIDKTIAFFRNNQKASWIFSLLVGVTFSFAYGVAKNIWAHSIWRVMEYAASLMELGSDFNSVKVIFITIGVNLLTDLPAAFIASLFCSALMIYVLRTQRLLYSLGVVAAFFLLYLRGWHFRNAPDLGVQISAFMAPFLIVFVFIFTFWLLIKLQIGKSKQKL
jgi:hypothetical protein